MNPEMLGRIESIPVWEGMATLLHPHRNQAGANPDASTLTH